MKAELTFETLDQWFRCQPPEVQRNLQREGLDPDSVNQEVKRLAEEGRGTRDYKMKIMYGCFYWSSDKSTQQQIKEGGLYDPDDDYGVVKNNRNESDPGESNTARTESHEYSESTTDVLHELLGGSESTEALERYIEARVQKEVEMRVSHNLQQVVGVFLAAPNARIAAAGLAFAAGLSALNGLKNQTQFARLIGVSKGAVSKSTRYWKVLLDLPDNPHMKTEPACESYSRAQKKAHWRNRPYESVTDPHQ